MQLSEIIRFWANAQCQDEEGRWSHRDDAALLRSTRHSFNLKFPVSPYIGDVQNAPVVILGANARYSERTAAEFPNSESISSYIHRVNEPSASDWSRAAAYYYSSTNYGDLVAAGKAVFVNACAYRSPKISEERDNQKLLHRLPSVLFMRRWLLDAVVPLALSGRRLVVGKRCGLWKLPSGTFDGRKIIRDNAPISSYITGSAFSCIRTFLSSYERS